MYTEAFMGEIKQSGDLLLKYPRKMRVGGEQMRQFGKMLTAAQAEVGLVGTQNFHCITLMYNFKSSL